MSLAAGGRRRGAARGAAQVPHESGRCVVPAASTQQLVSAGPQLLLARRLRVELVCVCALCSRRTPGVHTHIHGHRQSGAENAEWIVECHVIQHGAGGGGGVTGGSDGGHLLCRSRTALGPEGRKAFSVLLCFSTFVFQEF